MKTVYDFIASEIMDVIERERRINKDDLIVAAEMGMRKHAAATEQAAKDNRLAMQACADTKRALAQAKQSEDAKREFYGNNLQQFVANNPTLMAWWNDTYNTVATSSGDGAPLGSTTILAGSPFMGSDTHIVVTSTAATSASKPEDFVDQTDAGLCILTPGRVCSRKSRMTE